MNRISPEMDRLMWALAEADNSTAIDEFGERYPEHRAEMTKRLRVVSGIKGAKLGAKPRTDVPKFLPPVKPAAPNPRLQWVAAGLAVLAIISVGLAVIMRPAANGRKPIEQLPLARTGSNPPQQVVSSAPEVIRANQLPLSDNPKGPPITSKEAPDRSTVDRENPANRPKDVQLSKVSLREAIALITDGSGLKVELAPGFPEPEISVEYTAKSTHEILEDLAAQYGFSILDEGDSQLLLVPVNADSKVSQKRLGG